MTRIIAAQSPTNLADIFKGFGRRKALIAGTALAGLLCGLAFLALNKPVYQSEAQVLVQNQATPFDKSTAVADGSQDTTFSDRMVTSQVSVLKSNDINARVVDQLGLDTKPEYNAQLRKPGTLGGLMIKLGLKDDPALFNPKQLAAKTLGSDVAVYPVPDSNVIGIKSNSSDPELAAATANAIAETYVLSTHETDSSANDRARTWLGKQIDDLRAKVSASENAVEKYRAEAGLLKGQSSTLGTQEISELNSQITVAETARAEAIARVNEIRNLLAARGTVDASADVLSSVIVQNLREQQVAAQRKVSELSAVYLPNHPKMIAAQKELDAVNAQVRNEAMKIIDSLTGQAKVADARATSLRASLEKLKGSETEANYSDVKLKELEREAEANRTLLQNMLNRYADVNARQDVSLQPGYARIIQKAVVPATPFFPKATTVLLLSGIAGLAFGMGLAFVLGLLSAPPLTPPVQEEATRRHPARRGSPGTMRVPDIDFTALNASMAGGIHPESNVARDAAVVVAGSMPAAVTASAPLAMLQELDGAAVGHFGESAARLAQTLQDIKKARGASSFAFTSLGTALPNAALATIALARSLAARGEKVVALDVGPPGSGFETLLGLSPGPGLTDLVAGRADFTKVVVKDPRSSLHVVRLGQREDANAQAALAGKLEGIIKALNTIYGFVLLHAGDANAQAVPLLEAAQATVILATASRLKDADAAARALEEGGSTSAIIVKLEPETGNSPATAASA